MIARYQQHLARWGLWVAALGVVAALVGLEPPRSGLAMTARHV